MKFRYILAAAALCSLVSCNEKEVFEKEQYKNIFGFVCESDNTKQKVVSLHLEEATAYVSISMGGSNPPKQDVTINFEEDNSLIDSYNSSNFDTDVAKYAVALPDNSYDIDNYTCTIKAGERLGVVPVKVYPQTMSIDKTYFLPLRVTDYNNAEMDPEKGTILFQVGIKNHWAAFTGTTYAMLGTRRAVTDFTNGQPVEGTAGWLNMPASKIVYPRGNNEISVMPANEAASKDHHVMEQKLVIIEVGEAGADKVHPVTLHAFRDLNIQMVGEDDANWDEDYPNTYSIIDDGFTIYKTFLLNYYYTLDGSSFYQMKEELRVEYEEDKDVDEGFEIIELQQ